MRPMWDWTLPPSSFAMRRTIRKDPVPTSWTQGRSRDPVVSANGDELGKIETMMLDVRAGRIAYAVLSFGGFLGVGDKLFAIPWSAFTLDARKQRLVLDISRQRLESPPGFVSSSLKFDSFWVGINIVTS